MDRLIDQLRDINFIKANSIIRQLSGIVDYFSSEDEKVDFISAHAGATPVASEDRASYGDWQTPVHLAGKVCDEHLLKFGSPDVVIEPTCGRGAFVFSALEKFRSLKEIHALEINPQYVNELKFNLLQNALNTLVLRDCPAIYIYTDDFFRFDFSPIISRCKTANMTLAVVGNPPWVTNSRQGKYGSGNIPQKRNSFGLKGIDAITGKSNFDISENITLQLLRLSQMNNGGISFLLKNSVIRGILMKQHIENFHIGNIEQRPIDASSEFNVSVEASCFCAQFGCTPSYTCRILDSRSDSSVREYGWLNGSFVADTKLYGNVSKYDKKSSYVWRSGIKHDCASVLELTCSDGVYTNGFGETVEIEPDLIYPLLKSSDINNYQDGRFRKFIIVPQRRVGEDTSGLKYTHPLAFSYLTKYEHLFAGRKSSIYKGKDRFSIFGIGDYSFKPYKIVVSSLYKSVRFVLVTPFEGSPVMVDDTCYQLDFDSLKEAQCILNALDSHEIRSLLQSLVFKDAKRVVTKSLLMRLDLAQLCREKGMDPTPGHSNDSTVRQLTLFE